ncbi:(-)-germacrene D synthase-like [Rhododendron vialii]|uniref:(-)-germacrene D synthase-like n=1 Tax=Rhododendron vialii TaxID=182163 RepID=UPI00265E0FB1|nr:(-)-germacrene D synthase-like [Rhododendron vialii]
MDDMAGHKHEQERGHVASAVECYMKQHGVTEEEVYVEFRERVANAWKDMNAECLRPTAVPMPVLARVLNLARVINLIYTGGDGYTHSGKKVKQCITSVLIDSFPIN